jgi:aminocarboxymuconate-semialdehyde decarboxylase
MIDVHAHGIPDGFRHALADGGAALGVEFIDTGNGTKVSFAGINTSAPLKPELADHDVRLAAMDGAGISVQLVSPFIDLVGYALPGPAGATYSRLVNELMAETVRRHPDRLRALATVPLQDGELAAEELRHAVTVLGMAGVEIGTHTPDGHLDDPQLEPFWAAAAELGCLVLLHPLSGGSAQTPYFLGNLVGNPAETTMAAARLMFGGVLDAYPGLEICLVHGGGFLPYQAGRLEHGFQTLGTTRGAKLRTSPRELLTRFHYDTVLHSGPMLRTLIDLVGAERVLLGTDYPFEMGDADPITTLATIPDLTTADRDLIVRENAERIILPQTSAMRTSGH